MNKLIISGRLVADPEIRHTGEGKPVASFRFAVNRTFRKEGEPEADFFSCVAFGKLAEVVEKCNVSKGTKLLIEGEDRNNNYEKDGVKYYGNQVIVKSFEFCESKSSIGSEPTSNEYDGLLPLPDDDDLPFGG